MTAISARARDLDLTLPGLSLLMHEDLLRTWLAERSESLISRGPLRYKPGTTAVAAVRLESGPAFLYAAADRARAKLEKTIVQAPPGTLLIRDERAGLLLAGIAADRDLPAARDLPKALARVCRVPADRLDVTLLVHNPQRRVVVRSVDPDGRMLVSRAYRRSRLADAIHRHRAALNRSVTSAEIVGQNARRALVALTHLPGQTLEGASSDGSTDLWRHVGSTLAGLHDRPHADDRPQADDVVTELVADRADPADTVDFLSHVLPATASRWSQVLRRIGDARQVSEPVFCHGDFSADQVVRSDVGDLAFIDWDRAGWAAAAVDLAGLPAAGLSEEAFAEVLEGYAETRPVPADLSIHVAEARVLRAADPFRTSSATWESDIEDELAAIERMLS